MLQKEGGGRGEREKRDKERKYRREKYRGENEKKRTGEKGKKSEQKELVRENSEHAYLYGL